MNAIKILAVSLLTAGALSSYGNDALRPAVKTQAEIFAALDNSIWIADGKVPERQIYVISAPWCPICRAFYQHAGRYTDRVQFRWIETGARDSSSSDSIAEAATQRDGSVLNRLYETHDGPPRADPTIRENAVRYNTMTERALEARILELTRGSGKTATGYPMLIWLSKDGIKALIGAPDRLDEIVNAVVPRPEAAAIRPAGLLFLSMQYRSQPVQGTYFGKRDAVQLFSFPDVRSQPVYSLASGTGFNAVRKIDVNGETWIELAVFQAGPGLFVRAAEVQVGR